MFKKIIAWFVIRFTRPVPVGRPAKGQKTTLGELNLAEALDVLPLYHRILEKTPHRVRLDNAAIYKMGPLITNRKTTYQLNDPKRWRRNPTLVCVGWPPEIDGPNYLAALKVDPPPGVERHPGECYQYLLYYDFTATNKPKWSNWYGGYCWVDALGNFKLARQRKVVQHTIPRKHKKRGAARAIQVPMIEYSDTFFEVVHKRKEKAEEGINLIFRSGFNHWADRGKGWLVVTKKGTQRVTFNITEGRHKYFFREREKIVETPTGQRKRIFHIVDEHMRETHGKTVRVKEHTRGIRHFFWQGFECHIFSPGWHGHDFFKDLDVITYAEEDLADNAEFVEMSSAVEKGARVIEGTDYRADGSGWG